jgi:hypothetical protein
MYAQRELIRLSVHKAALRRRIALRRVELTRAVVTLARPLAWFDRAVALWRRLSPLAVIAAVPIAFLITRKRSPRFKMVGSILKWAPLVFGAVREISGAARTRFTSPRSS